MKLTREWVLEVRNQLDVMISEKAEVASYTVRQTAVARTQRLGRCTTTKLKGVQLRVYEGSRVKLRMQGTVHGCGCGIHPRECCVNLSGRKRPV